MPQAPIRDSPRARYGAGPPPYAAIEVAFHNVADDVQLAGTLTVLQGTPNAPAVLLSQGLGFEPFDRDYAVPSAPALQSFGTGGGDRDEIEPNDTVAQGVSLPGPADAVETSDSDSTKPTPVSGSPTPLRRGRPEQMTNPSCAPTASRRCLSG